MIYAIFTCIYMHGQPYPTELNCRPLYQFGMFARLEDCNARAEKFFGRTGTISKPEAEMQETVECFGKPTWTAQ